MKANHGLRVSAEFIDPSSKKKRKVGEVDERANDCAVNTMKNLESSDKPVVSWNNVFESAEFGQRDLSLSGEFCEICLGIFCCNEHNDGHDTPSDEFDFLLDSRERTEPMDERDDGKQLPEFSGLPEDLDFSLSGLDLAGRDLFEEKPADDHSNEVPPGEQPKDAAYELLFGKA